jgi:heterodisulfide reductase subunit C
MQQAFTYFQQICFIAALIGAGLVVKNRIFFIRRNILLGKPLKAKGSLKKMALFALGQKKMFTKPLVGAMHFVIYAGFLIVNIEVAEIVLDGLLGTHRLFAPWLGGAYRLILGVFELLALGVVLTCVVFLIRRNVLKLPRFTKPELKGWPALDANVILLAEIALMFALFTMNATDSVLQNKAQQSQYVAEHYHAVGSFWVSGLMMPIFEPLEISTLIFLERSAWWLHILGIMTFAVYVTYSKHLHIFLAFPNTYFSSEQPKGQMLNMPAITQEVKIMLGEVHDTGNEQTPERFGVKDVTDLSWKNLLDAYSCTECGRCSSACPANLTGKLLSPRKIMMDTRDRMEEIGYALDNGEKDPSLGKSLYGDYISKEELMACTTCNACVEACPVNINPLEIILQMRRYVAMEEASTPASWNSMFNNIENNSAPWAMPNTQRFKYASEV